MNNTFNHLLVIEDIHSTAHYALDRAIAFAKKKHSAITVFKSYYQQMHKMGTESSDDMADFVMQQQREICQHISTLTDQDVSLNIVISWLEPVKYAVRRLIEQSNISLVLKAQSKRHMFDLINGNLDHFLINDLEVPVWLVKPQSQQQELNVLACLDLDQDNAAHQMVNDKILQTSQQLSPALQSKLHVVNCCGGESVSVRIQYDKVTGFKQALSPQQEHQAKLEPYLTRNHLDSDCGHIRVGLPDDEIPAAVHSFQAQLAIIGNQHLHSKVARFWGNTTHYLVRHIPCDVLVVKPCDIKRHTAKSAVPKRLLQSKQLLSRLSGMLTHK